MRPVSLLKLLESVRIQTAYPDEIIVVDGSNNQKTERVLQGTSFKNLKYFKVSENDRGLTKQRNFGISKCSNLSNIICFLDDDTVLKENYFNNVLQTFKADTNIVGVGGVAINENRWQPKANDKKYNKLLYYEFDGFVIKEGLRNIVRNLLGLQANLPPNCMPKFSHGRTYSYPLNDKIYEVDLLVGMSMSFKKEVVDAVKFSTYFEGYGLYEDADFSIRAQKIGKNVMSTSCQLWHNHDQSGRPNQYKYGKMVVRNGWYVWRLKHPNPSFKNSLKWHFIIWTLLSVRLLNSISTKNKKQAFTEFLGRIAGWISLFIKKPIIE